MPDLTPGPTGLSCQGTTWPAGEHGLTGCLATVGGGCRGGLKLPESGHTLAPWVAITFEGSNSTITVGNASSPNTDPQNVACISSFEFGYSDGLTCRCTIQDEQGGSFVMFMQHLLKDYVCLRNGSPAAVRMKVQFGWAKGDCGAPLPVASSRCYYCLSDSVETNYREGKFVFEITGKDLCHRMFEGGCSQAYGGTGNNAMAITQAVTEFMTRGCPPNVASVRFCRMENGACQPCPFKMDGSPSAAERLAGPKGQWTCSGQDKLSVILNWLKGHPSDRNKGWIPQYNSENPNGEIIFWEDSKPTEAQGDTYWDTNCIGTYIVNGGMKSSVIEFSPKIRWDFARLTSNGGQLGDGTVNATGQPGSRQPGERNSGLDARGQPCVGQTTQATSSETHRDNLGAGAVQGVIQGVNAQNRALKILHDNIEADLTIVGDPTLLPPSEAMWAKNVTIILVNPYYLRKNGTAECNLEWSSSTSPNNGLVAVSPCNEVLSSKAWLCKSISHKIELGKYTTTIGIYMAAPGIDAPVNAPLGNWSGGWRPSPQC